MSSSHGLDTVDKAPISAVDETLEFLQYETHVTGHSVVDPGEHVSVHYNEKVINTNI